MVLLKAIKNANEGDHKGISRTPSPFKCQITPRSEIRTEILRKAIAAGEDA
jgi:hypothetical protein